MAKINEQIITIKLSQLVREDQDTVDILSEDMIVALIEAIQEMAGSSTLIELE